MPCSHARTWWWCRSRVSVPASSASRNDGGAAGAPVRAVLALLTEILADPRRTPVGVRPIRGTPFGRGQRTILATRARRWADSTGQCKKLGELL